MSEQPRTSDVDGDDSVLEPADGVATTPAPGEGLDPSAEQDDTEGFEDDG